LNVCTGRVVRLGKLVQFWKTYLIRSNDIFRTNGKIKDLELTTSFHQSCPAIIIGEAKVLPTDGSRLQGGTVTQTQDWEDVVDESVEPAAEEQAEKKSKRPAMPDGYGTPIEFAHALTAKLREEGKLGENEDFKPQVVYSNIRNKAKTNPIPVVFVDPEGNEYEEPADGLRPAFRKDENGVLAEALAWWDEKDARVAARKENAAKKAAEKSERAKSKPAKSETTEAVEADGVEEYEVDDVE
jgi:hypothetical protein